MNQVSLYGHLGANPEMRYTDEGTPVTNARLATTESYQNRDGDRVEQTEWHNLVVWGRAAEVFSEYLEKGDPVLVTRGKLQTRSWEDKEGNARQTTEVKVLSFEFVGSGQKKEPETEMEDDELPF